MGILPKNVNKKIGGPSWEGLREKYLQLANTLLHVSPEATADMTTVYVTYAVSKSPSSPVYAVTWIKNSKKWVVGLSLPTDFESPELGPAPPLVKYGGLTKFFLVTPDDTLSPELHRWATAAYENAISSALSPRVKKKR